MAEEGNGYVVLVYPARGVPPERTDFEDKDKAKAEKAFNDAKAAAILWLARTPAQGLGWVKLKEKTAP
ncbi:MAG: hypothetical protein ABSE73_28405 [Planctomycetota bacterium]